MLIDTAANKDMKRLVKACYSPASDTQVACKSRIQPVGPSFPAAVLICPILIPTNTRSRDFKIEASSADLS